MKSTPKQIKVRNLLKLKKNGILIANAEYQRGSVWSLDQKKRLIDSLFRQYPLPLIYLHRRRVEVDDIVNERFEVIDGQQRTNALYEFSESAFKLFEPIKDADQAKFPSFLQDEPCPWGGNTFDSLENTLKDTFLETELAVVYVETEVENEARDLFIRLQGGLPLNAQEKRDAWPGNFTEFILRIGGKPEIARYPGHDFFSVAMKTKANKRGEVRQLAAQMMMLYLSRRSEAKLCDTNRNAIDEFYYQHLDYDLSSTEVKRFGKILDILTDVLRDGKRKKLQGYEAMSLVLLVDSLMEDYTQSWKEKLAHAFDAFRMKAALGAKTRWETSPDEYWSKYGILARTNSDRADTIERRHSFFAAKMYELLSPIALDPTRPFAGLEREIIYYRDAKRCQVPGCGIEVAWMDAEIHHVNMHSKGGATTLDNGALVHKKCHPKSEAAVQAFADVWASKHATTIHALVL